MYSLFKTTKVATCTFLLLAMALPSMAEEHRLPPAAAKVIKANFPDARITDIGRERERGAYYYEVDLKQGSRRFEVEVTKEGVIGEIEAKIKISDVPAELMKAIRKRVGDGRIVRVEKHERRGIARRGKFVPLKSPRIMYEVKYYTADGDRREVQVASDEFLELPRKVLAAIKREFPGAKVREVEAEDDEGVMLFVVELEHEEGDSEVIVDRKGRIVERETSLEMNDVPVPVRRSLREDPELRKTKNVEVVKREIFFVVEKERLVGRHDVLYIARAKRRDEEREYRFDGRGKLLETSDWESVDDDDDDDDDDDNDDDDDDDHHHRRRK